jgi:hypothetical protein
MRYLVKTLQIGYCVEQEDVCWQFDNQADLEEDSEEYYDAINAEVERIKNSLPQVLELVVECDPEDLDDMVSGAISEETGWLINWADYQVIKQY